MRVNEVSFKLNHKYINHKSNDVPLEGLSHRLVVAAGDLKHEVFVQVARDLIDGIHCGHELIFLLSSDVKDSEAIPSPFPFH